MSFQKRVTELASHSLTRTCYLDRFRRCPLAEIAKGSIKPFSVSVILVKPSQRIVVSVSCDMFGTSLIQAIVIRFGALTGLMPSRGTAGSEVRAEVKPATKASSFPVPGQYSLLAFASRTSALKICVAALSSDPEEGADELRVRLAPGSIVLRLPETG